MGTVFAFTPPNGAEWIVLLLIFLLLFGAKKLPELGGSVGKSIKNFKRGIDEGKTDDVPEQPAQPHVEQEPVSRTTRDQS